MLTIVAATLILALADDKEALVQAVTRTAALDSYAFKGETEFQSPIGNAPGQIPSMDGKYQKDGGLYIKSDRGEIFRKGDRTFIKQPQGDWQDVATANLQPPAPPAGEAPKKRPRGGPFAQMMIRNFKAPHDELKDLAKGLKEVKRQEKTQKIGDVECIEYFGDLSEEAMKSAPLGRLLGQFGGPNASVSGSARVWVDPAGNVMIYEVVTKAAIDIQGNQVDLTLTRRSEISDAGKVKVETPEGVQKLLSEKPKAEEKKTEDK